MSPKPVDVPPVEEYGAHVSRVSIPAAQEPRQYGTPHISTDMGQFNVTVVQVASPNKKSVGVEDCIGVQLLSSSETAHPGTYSGEEPCAVSGRGGVRELRHLPLPHRQRNELEGKSGWD